MLQLLDSEIEDILVRDDERAMERWMEHHLNGDWFTSRLLYLLNTSDHTNQAKLELGYPSVVGIWKWWKTGRNPRKAEPVNGPHFGHHHG